MEHSLLQKSSAVYCVRWELSSLDNLVWDNYTASRIKWVVLKLNKCILDLLHRNRKEFADKITTAKLAINTYAYQLGTLYIAHTTYLFPIHGFKTYTIWCQSAVVPWDTLEIQNNLAIKTLYSIRWIGIFFFTKNLKNVYLQDFWPKSVYTVARL